MNKELLFDAIGQINDDFLVRHRQMDLRLAREYARKQTVRRLLVMAACLVLVVALCLPLASLHPAGRAVIKGDSAALTEYLMGIDGFAAWQDKTAQMLEQNLPLPLWQMMQSTPILDVLTQSEFSGLTAQDSFADGKPYRLYFLSNGDGTCALKYVTTDPEVTEDYMIEIPMVSPAGDTVTAIDLGQFTRIRQAQQEDFPYVLTASAMNELCETAKANNMNSFDYGKLRAYYLKLSLENLDAQERRAMLAAFPIVAFGDVYVFDTNATVGEINKIYEYLTEYCEWSEEKYLQSVDEIVALAKCSPDREYAELCLTVLRNADVRQAVGISIPKSVRLINSAMWEAFPGLKTVDLAQDHPTFEMVDGCLVEPETGTLKLYMREDGRFPDGADIRILDAHAFTLCSLQPDAEGELLQFALYLPESVTDLGDDCFDGLSAKTEGIVHVYLPAGLRYFGTGENAEYTDGLIYHYPDTLEAWESNIAFGEVDEDSCIWLVTSDASQPIQYTFSEK